MNWSNIWNHPKTSIAGLLIALVTVAGVLSGQDITLGRAGNGTVVQLLAGLATAFLGLISRDPSDPTPLPGATVKLGAWALIALLLPLPFIGGCSGPTVAQDIVNWTPALQSAVATVDSAASMLAPADAPIFAAATATFNVGSNLVVAQAKAYLANPTQSILAILQAQVVALQQNVSAAVLQAARIVDPTSQLHALAAINGVATIVNAILAEIGGLHGSTVAALATSHTITLARLDPYLDHSRAVATIAAHYGISQREAVAQVAQAHEQLARAGF